LIFENGLSQVDSPCSGVKSLWSGGMFLLAATWIEARRINRRWLLVAFSFGVLLLAANLARVALLVLTGQALGWQLIAEMLHVPLGVIGFLAACAAALAMLRRAGQPAPAEAAPKDQSWTAPCVRPAWLAPALAAVLIGMVLLYTPRPQPAAAAGSAAAWHFPSELVVQEWPLTDTETDWLSSDGALPVTAARWHFEWRGLRGSLLFVTSATWRAQHRPERCFTVYGLEVQESRLLMAGVDFPLRWLTLRPASASLPRDPQAVYTAGYWLQSSERVTDDYSVRIWDDMAPQPEPWVLATILFDGPTDPSSPAAQALFSALRQSVQTGLQRP
jgi:exosortase O